MPYESAPSFPEKPRKIEVPGTVPSDQALERLDRERRERFLARYGGETIHEVYEEAREDSPWRLDEIKREFGDLREFGATYAKPMVAAETDQKKLEEEIRFGKNQYNEASGLIARWMADLVRFRNEFTKTPKWHFINRRMLMGKIEELNRAIYEKEWQRLEIGVRLSSKGVMLPENDYFLDL